MSLSKDTIYALAAAIVAIITIAAVFYVASDLNHCGGRTPAVMVNGWGNITGGVKFEFTATTSDVFWDDVTIRLSVLASFSDQEYETISWKNISRKALTGPYPPEEWHYGHGKDLLGLNVFLNVTDISGNGKMSHGDYITLTVGGGSFEPGSKYTLALLYEPTCGLMLEYDFTI